MNSCLEIEPRIERAYLKCYARRTLEAYQSPYNDPFEYRSILDYESRDTHAIIAPLIKLEVPELDPCEEARLMVDHCTSHAGTAYDPRHWFIPMLGSEPVGVVFPQLFEDSEQYGGSIFHIGVLPKFRGRGFGKILHAHGLETLRALGAKKYVGSTPPDNIAMQRVFRANGCDIYGVYLIEEFENGSGRALTS